jgi:hypothetical protein
MEFRKCTRCKIEKENNFTFFGVHKNKKGIVVSNTQCRDCMRLYDIPRNAARKIERASKKLPPPKFKNCSSCNEEKENTIENFSRFMWKDKEYLSGKCRECVRKYDRGRSAKLRIESPVFNIRKTISSAILVTLKENKSSKDGKSCLDYLPQSIESLKIYIENQFSAPENLTPDGKVWMSWETWGKYSVKGWDDNDPSTWRWQLDHIKPHSDFKYTTMDCQEFRECWDVSNLRPYSAKQNIRDGNRRNNK